MRDAKMREKDLAIRTAGGLQAQLTFLRRILMQIGFLPQKESTVIYETI